MKWNLAEPSFGDMIRVKVGPLYHYGIYVSDDEIIQFGVNPALRQGIPDPQIEVCVTDMEKFLCGEFLEIAIPEGIERFKRRKPNKVTEAARKRLGEKGYSILYNNCEHFAYECFIGEKYCSQTENVRNLFKTIPIVDLYIAAIPQGEISPVFPPKRQEQIENTNNPELKKQRYYVWKLLEYALNRSLGYKISNLSFEEKEGKWSCRECYFSLSHSEKAVAVAVSRAAVGVDIEILKPPAVDGFASKILTEKELQEFKSAEDTMKNEFLIKKWCAKESIFKAEENQIFKPQSSAADENTKTGTIEISGDTYCYAVTSKSIEKLRIYKDIEL